MPLSKHARYRVRLSPGPYIVVLFFHVKPGGPGRGVGAGVRRWTTDVPASQQSILCHMFCHGAGPLLWWMPFQLPGIESPELRGSGRWELPGERW